ncbi:MAG: site-specific DNA-methyltransferase [Bdellovibrionales bacterium]|nr:site-specific DNA-methyltransferase [Bdellovibrionales bacterium]
MVKLIKPKSNTIFQGDNFPIMRAMPDECVDLIYIDPPFFTQRDYKNIWGDMESVQDYKDIRKNGFTDKKDFFERHLKSGAKELDAYLEWMRFRVQECRRILKKTGSFYLHLDYHAVHYMKVVCDEIFGYKNFRNEIIWKRTVGGSNTSKKQYGVTTDTILFYTKSNDWRFNVQYTDYDDSYIKSHYSKETKDGRKYQLGDLTAPSHNPSTIYKYKGYKPPKNGWRWTKEKMKEMDRKGCVHFPKNKNKRLRQIRYLDEQKGVPISNLWTDIPPVNSQAKEDTGWPTQKPVSLLERILKIGSNPGDIILDSFSGCGTAMHAAHNLKRKWIGIDISPTAIKVNKERLEDLGAKVEVITERELKKSHNLDVKLKAA